MTADTILQSHHEDIKGKSIREDLDDVIHNISPVDHPVFQDASFKSSKGKLHEWLVDVLASRGTNAATEGSDVTVGLETQPTRKTNIVQILRKTVGVSDTQRAIVHAGFKDAFNYYATKKAKELANDIEFTIINQTLVTGATNAIDYMSGLLDQITTTASQVAQSVLTETAYNDLLELIWAQGGTPDVMYLAAYHKRRVDEFLTKTDLRVMQQNVDSDKVRSTFTFYLSVFGLIENKLSRDIPFTGNSTGGTIVAGQKDMLRFALLRKTKLTPLAKTGSSTRAFYETEGALEVGNEKAFGKYTKLKAD
ncbi:DUF5309 family protein [Patescibacteria group bacterium]|nr:DUF5309 family protein [Patescibacteria group bacterium]